jgi:hypothetical protein
MRRLLKAVPAAVLDIPEEDLPLGQEELLWREQWIIFQGQGLTAPGGKDGNAFDEDGGYHIHISAEPSEQWNKTIFGKKRLHF